MKKTIMILLLIGSVLCIHAQTKSGEAIASQITGKMKDTLGLTDAQKDAIHTINMDLHNKKLMARKQSTNMDSVRINIQAVENTRDELYKGILTPRQFELYRQKKRTLLSTN